MRSSMNTRHSAKLFANGASQAVRLPAEFRFEGTEVYIRRDPRSGEVILSPKVDRRWADFAALRDELHSALVREGEGDYVPERPDRISSRDPFEGWGE